GSLNGVFLRGDTVAQPRAGDTAVAACDLQNLRVIADHSSGFHAFRQPFGYQALREFALRVFVAIDGPGFAVIELPLKRAEVAGDVVLSAGPAMVEPQTGPDSQRTTQQRARFFWQRQQKLNRADQVRKLAEHAFTFTQRFAHQAELGVLKIAQAAVDDP